jgi:hypothetical protein
MESYLQTGAPPQFVEEVQQQGHNEQVSFEGD